MKLPVILQSKLFLILMIIILSGGIYLQYQKFEKQKALDEEIQSLENEREALTKKNEELEQSLKFFASNEYQEMLAKEQLGLQREGEIVVNFPQDSDNSNQTEITQSESNPAKWWRYIFKTNI